MTDQELNFLNVVPIFAGNEEFTVSEILRQYRTVGIRQFALSLSFHPEGTPARKKIGILTSAAKKVQALVHDEEPGVQFGILIQSTQGHGWSGPVPLTGETWMNVVRLVPGKNVEKVSFQKNSRICMTDRGFQEYILCAVEECMKLQPEFLIWDDDYGLRTNECFCDNHIRLFNEANQSNYSREEIAEMLQSRPWNAPEVLLFSRQRGQFALDFLKEVRSVIDRYNPHIWCFLCTCGRGFAKEYLEALAGPTAQPAARPGNAIYGCNQPLWFYNLDLRTNIIVYQYHDCARKPAFIDEADTFPQSYYSENAALFNAHLILSILNGFCGAKLWMSEFNQPVNEGWQSRYENTFRENLPLYEELFRTMRGKTDLGAASLCFKPEENDHPLLVNCSYDYPSWAVPILGPYCVPLRYGDGSDGGLYALTGDEVKRLSDEQLPKLFAHALLLDSLAAKELTRRGFADDMGVKTVEDPEFFFQSEFDVESNMAVPMMWEENCCKLECVSEKTQIASFCALGNSRTGEERSFVSPCMTFFTNAKGGRVAVTAWPVSLSFYKTMRPPRRKMILRALDFLNGGLMDMTVEILHQNLVRHFRLADGSELLAVLSMGADGAPEIPVRTAVPMKELTMLTSTGEWIPVQSEFRDNLQTIAEPLKYSSWSIFRFNR